MFKIGQVCSTIYYFAYAFTLIQASPSYCSPQFPFDARCPSRETQDLSGSTLYAHSIRTSPLSNTESKEISQIYGWSLDAARGKTLSVGGLAIPKSFRLIDCDAYRKNTIQVVEWRSFNVSDKVPYHAISYVWKGNRKSPISDSFAVEGATGSDRVDVEVLQVACARKDYIWLDQLCILQTNSEDKDWQIQNMATFYKGSVAGLVLVGGVGGLTGLDERTSWIDRSWTLQEAVIPPNVHAIFKWTRGSGVIQSSGPDPLQYPLAAVSTWDVKASVTSISDRYGEMSLLDLLQISSYKIMFESSQGEKEELFFPAFSISQPLISAIMINDFHGDVWVGPPMPLLHEFEIMVWRSAMTRTSTRDIDPVYSIMGIFGVQLDPAKYATRLEALIALLQNILEKGGKATWLAASVVTPGILPPLPVSIEQNVPSVGTPSGLVEANVLMEGLDWYIANPPTGFLDDSGTLSIIAPFSSVKIRIVGPPGECPYTFGFQYNAIIEEKVPILLSGRVGTHAVALGTMVHILVTHTRTGNSMLGHVLVMLLEPSGGKWCKVGMARVPHRVIKGWGTSFVTLIGKEDGDLYI